MRLNDVVVIWTPGTDKVRVERHQSNWERTSADHWMPAYALGEMGDYPRSPITDLLGLFILFNTITVRDRVPVQKAHEVFLEIDEYRKAISPDATGADNEGPNAA